MVGPIKPIPGGKSHQGDETHEGLKRPGAGAETFAKGQPASQGIGFSGAAEGAVSQDAGMAASMGTCGAGGSAPEEVRSPSGSGQKASTTCT